MMEPIDKENAMPEEPIYFFCGYPFKTHEKSLKVNIDGDKGCIFRDLGVFDPIDDSLLLSKIQTFGFPLDENIMCSNG